MRPAKLRPPLGSFIAKASSKSPASSRICLVRSVITSMAAITMPTHGAHRRGNGRCPRFPGIFTNMYVRMLEKTAKLTPQVIVCDNCRPPGVFMSAKAGPRRLAISNGQHQDPTRAGIESAIIAPAAQKDRMPFCADGAPLRTLFTGAGCQSPQSSSAAPPAAGSSRRGRYSMTDTRNHARAHAKILWTRAVSNVT